MALFSAKIVVSSLSVLSIANTPSPFMDEFWRYTESLKTVICEPAPMIDKESKIQIPV